MRKFIGVLGGLILLASNPAHAAQIPLFVGPACEESSQTLSCLNQLITQLNTQLATTPPLAAPKNYLDNGAMQVIQRGTGAATCALNGAAITSAAYGPDRWGCEVNVGSGNGTLTSITATPSPPLQFQRSVKLVRAGGALAQPQCAYQEIASYRAIQLQGQQVTFSVYEQALAGLAADQGSTTQSFNLVVITGTGTDEGLGTWTASPAITPAVTGVATAVNTNFITPVTPSWQRYSTTAAIPTTATEIAVAICFTPTTSGQSATDGIAFTGAQLEQGALMTQYEFRSPGAELAEAQRYYYQYADNLANTFVIGMCQSNTTTVDICVLPNPVTMRTTPTVAVATATSFAVTVPAGTTQACTTLAAVASTNSPTAIELSCTVAANLVAGSASRFTYSNTGATNTVTVSADF